MTTSLYAALLALVFIALSVNVIRGRRAAGVAVGDNQQHDLLRRMRAQGNFAEYAPLFLILLAFAEMQGLHVWAVHGFGVVFLAGRVLHAYSLLVHEQYRDGKLLANPRFRIMGMMATFASLALLSTVLLAQYVQGCCL